jgi:hypothetical protein
VKGSYVGQGTTESDASGLPGAAMLARKWRDCRGMVAVGSRGSNGHDACDSGEARLGYEGYRIPARLWIAGRRLTGWMTGVVGQPASLLCFSSTNLFVVSEKYDTSAKFLIVSTIIEHILHSWVGF